MRQTKYALAVPKNLGLGFDFRPRAISSPGVRSPWCNSMFFLMLEFYKSSGDVYQSRFVTMVCDASLLMQTFFQTINTTRTPTVVKRWKAKVRKLELNSAVFWKTQVFLTPKTAEFSSNFLKSFFYLTLWHTFQFNTQ